MDKPQVRRVTFKKSRPCFHCSKSLQQLPRSKGGEYVGFMLTVDGYERTFHQTCISCFLEDYPPETDGVEYRTYPERIAKLREDKNRPVPT